MELPNLISVQKESFERFMGEGLAESFAEFSPIENSAGTMQVTFGDHQFGDPANSMAECRAKDISYQAPLFVDVRFVNKETGEMKEQLVFMGDFPLMTERGTFIINGSERVVVSQLVRSPGVYFSSEMDNGVLVHKSQFIPARGAWLEFEVDKRGHLVVSIDRKRRQSATVFLRALGIAVTDDEILSLLGDSDVVRNTLERDVATTREDALIEIYRRQRPGEPPTVDSARSLLDGLFFNEQRYDLARVGRYKINKKLGEEIPADVRVLTKEDIVAALQYLLAVHAGDESKHLDDIDHFGNRRVRTVGELVQNQFRIGMSRMERVVRERMASQDADDITPQSLINIRPIVAAIKEFFGSSQLSQFMDQANPLAGLTHKRRLSALGPGGLAGHKSGSSRRTNVPTAVRDVHNSHYSRMCPIETPEGPNIGLIGSLALYAHVNEYGFIEAPYRKVTDGVVSDDIVWMTADEEENHIIAPANTPIDPKSKKFVEVDADGKIVDADRVIARTRDFDGSFGAPAQVPVEDVDYMDVSPRQLLSVAANLIPFLEHDDAKRTLMGANMQRQAVPLLRTQAPLVGTGMEYKAACDSGVMVLAKHGGEVTDVTADAITVRSDEGAFDTYKLQKFIRSNQATCINQKPLVYAGDRVTEGQPIADGPSTDNGELALGYNIIVAYMPWEGYNYEDAILLSENLVKRDLYTSIHIEEYECDARDTKLGPEEITRDIPNVAEEALKDLDEDGIISIGADVRPGDILVGKVTPKGETELTAEERLLRAIFGEKAREVRDTSLRVPHGEAGKIIDVKIFTRENNDELPPGVNRLVRVYIAQKRKISVGDKMSGRHGNKGVVSRIMRQEDMPFLPDGTPVDIVLNPLGVPSRMNIGQVLETHLGMACRVLGQRIKDGDPTVEGDLRAAGYDFDKNGMPVPDVAGIHIATPVFDGAGDDDVFGTIRAAGLPSDGKTVLYDGRTGEPFENRVTVGCVYMLKLHHLVDDKIHARSTGPYSLVTQQPLGGKAQFGGQRFGEMEVWALEAYGAAYTLQEILTVKSDDVVGRVKAYESIVKGDNIPEPGVPESFKVLIKELQAIGLDIKVLNEDAKEIAIRDEEDEDINEKARSLDLDVEGVDENGAAPPPPADDYDESAEAAESADEDLIADLGADEDLAADDVDAILHGGLDDIDNPHEDDL